ncbi:MAG: DUF3099 domain-containing protein [Actinomycetota bacterium]
MEKPQSITTVGESPELERRSRMLKYTIAMTIRVICIIAAIFVEGWLMWVAFAGAIFLPYFAVIIANAQGAKSGNLNPVTLKAAPITVDLSNNDFQKP